MVSFLYCGSYGDFEEGRLAGHAGMFAIAVKYCIPNLQEVARVNYWTTSQISWDVDDFLDSTPVVCQDTPETVRELRDNAQKCARLHMAYFVKAGPVRDRWRDVCISVPDFTFDVLTSIARSPVLGSCSSCGADQPLESPPIRFRRCEKGGAWENRSIAHSSD